MGQAHHIYARIGTNHARHFIGSRYTLLQLEARVLKVTLKKKNLISRKSRAYETILYIICRKITQI